MLVFVTLLRYYKPILHIYFSCTTIATACRLTLLISYTCITGVMLKITKVKVINATTVALYWRLNISQEVKYKIAKYLVMLHQSHSYYTRNEIISGTRNSYMITDLTPQTKYSMSIIAYDSRLHRRLTAKITVKTPSLGKIIYIYEYIVLLLEFTVILYNSHIRTL